MQVGSVAAGPAPAVVFVCVEVCCGCCFCHCCCCCCGQPRGISHHVGSLSNDQQIIYSVERPVQTVISSLPIDPDG